MMRFKPISTQKLHTKFEGTERGVYLWAESALESESVVCSELAKRGSLILPLPVEQCIAQREQSGESETDTDNNRVE